MQDSVFALVTLILLLLLMPLLEKPSHQNNLTLALQNNLTLTLSYQERGIFFEMNRKEFRRQLRKDS